MVFFPTAYQEIGATHRDGQVVTPSQFCNFPHIAEASTHDNRLVAEFLVVIENLLHALDARIFLWAIVFLICGFVPIKDTANKGRDEESSGFSTGNGLRERKHEGQIAVDTVFGLQDVGCLDSLPGGCKLDEDARLVDANGFVKLQNLS